VVERQELVAHVLVALVVALVFEFDGRIRRNVNPFTGNLNFKSFIFFESIGKPPQFINYFRSRIFLFDIYTC
jgi:hypothetical protein